MTYSHNSVSSNLKMTTTAAAASSTIRLKNGGGGFACHSSPPTTPPVTAHSSSIASSTNHHYFYQQQQQQHHVLGTSPPGCPLSSSASTSSSCSNSSDSSLGSSGNGSGGYFSSARQRKQQQQQQQHQRSRQQRQSPQQLTGSESSVYFINNHNHQTHHGKRGGAGNSQKQRDCQRSPNGQHTRQSPAVILGGGVSVTTSVNSSGSSGRKHRSKFAMNQSPLFSNGGGGGKISPTHPLIPTALTHFAGSKCFDAPAPTALPKPPEHWTLGKAEQKLASSAGPGLHSVTTARYPALAADAHTYGGHVVKTSKRNLLDDFDTHNLKLLLNVQS